jgi:hypothetical protein
MATSEKSGRKRKLTGDTAKVPKKQRRWTDSEVSDVFEYLKETIDQNFVIEVRKYILVTFLSKLAQNINIMHYFFISETKCGHLLHSRDKRQVIHKLYSVDPEGQGQASAEQIQRSAEMERRDRTRDPRLRWRQEF